jgi:dephospho-CoA kinase
MRVIGLTGRNCAGKDTVADLLVPLGFERHSLSDVLRVELAARGVPITREALIAVGRELREKEGPAVLAERMKRMIKTQRVVLVSVRSPVEVASLRRLPGFVLVAVEAPVEVRFLRESERRREQAPTTLQAFQALEAMEESTDPNAQQLGATIRVADVRLSNDTTREALAAKVARLLEDLHAG